MLLFNPGTGPAYFDLTFVLALMVVGMFTLVRFGLLTMVVGGVVSTLLQSATITPSLSAWYSYGMLIALAVVAGVAIYALRISLGGNSLFRPGVFET